jgi:osmotically-inducible protein OsmY
MGNTKDIREAVEAELEFEFDLLVDDADIHVVNIDGDVALNGTVLSYPQDLEAERAVAGLVGAAWMAGGVMQVRDDLGITG